MSDLQQFLNDLTKNIGVDIGYGAEVGIGLAGIGGTYSPNGSTTGQVS